MGCDGGTIPRRDELVRVKKKPESKDKEADLAFKWKCCAITQENLQEPVATCHLGKMYSKVALIEALLDRSTLPVSCKHIKSLKDIKQLNLTKNPAYNKDNSKKDGTLDEKGAPYICPVLSLEMNGKFRFVALWSCGCVFSERALKQINTKNCHKCTKPFEAEDVIILNGNEDDIELMRTRMESRQQQQKRDKGKKIKVKTEECTQTDLCKTSDDNSQKRTSTTKPESVINKKPKTTNTLSKIGNIISSGRVIKAEEIKKMKPDYSVAKDKNVSDVYKSLFTTHKSEQEQTRAHWITYNPFYN